MRTEFLLLLNVCFLICTKSFRNVFYRENYIRFHNLFASNANLQSNPVLSKFYSMVDRFSKYSNTDIMQLENDRLKHLIFGGKEALNDTIVLTSFAILYEDILPVRFGGDILFNIMEKIMSNVRKVSSSSVEKSKVSLPLEVSLISSRPSEIQRKIISQVISQALPEDLTRCDSLFAEIDSNRDGSLSFEEFLAWVSSVETSSLNVTDNILEALDVESLFSSADIDKNGSISFEEFKLWTTGLLVGEDECDPYTSKSIYDVPAQSPSTMKYRERYLHMVHSFAQWGTTHFESGGGVASNSSRMGLVVRGCFEGAKNPGVVKALGILYEDYLPLRVAGDVIFKLVEARMK